MFFILFLVALTCVGVAVWALVDAAMKPESAFRGAGMSKTMWVALIAGFIVVFAPIGFVLAIVYLTSVRPKLMTMA